MFEKVPKDDIQVIDSSEFYQIMRDFPDYAGLCGEDELTTGECQDQWSKKGHFQG